MRFNIKQLKIGDVRFKKRFLLFPKTIFPETRWLEYAEWAEEFVMGLDGPYWRPIGWLKKQEKGKKKTIKIDVEV